MTRRPRCPCPRCRAAREDRARRRADYRLFAALALICAAVAVLAAGAAYIGP